MQEWSCKVRITSKTEVFVAFYPTKIIVEFDDKGLYWEGRAEHGLSGLLVTWQERSEVGWLVECRQPAVTDSTVWDVALLLALLTVVEREVLEIIKPVLILYILLPLLPGLRNAAHT